MNKEFLRALTRLVDLGRMTKEEALRAFVEDGIEDLAPLVDRLHTVACVKQHACDPSHITRRKEHICYYELEEQLHDPWSFPDHREWMETIYQLMAECGPDKVQDIITAIGAINANAAVVKANSPTAVVIVGAILDALFASQESS